MVEDFEGFWAFPFNYFMILLGICYTAIIFKWLAIYSFCHLHIFPVLSEFILHPWLTRKSRSCSSLAPRDACFRYLRSVASITFKCTILTLWCLTYYAERPESRSVAGTCFPSANTSYSNSRNDLPLFSALPSEPTVLEPFTVPALPTQIVRDCHAMRGAIKPDQLKVLTATILSMVPSSTMFYSLLIRLSTSELDCYSVQQDQSAPVLQKSTLCLHIRWPNLHFLSAIFCQLPRFQVRPNPLRAGISAAGMCGPI